MQTRFAGAALAAALAVAGCSEDESSYQATIRWTSYGIPHIEASDMGGVAFGQGYAFAKQHACILLDQVVKVRSERAMWFGPGEDDANITSDFAHLAIDVYANAEEGLSELPEDVRAAISGYVAGYNLFLDQADGDLAGGCGGEPWAGPISEVDLYAHYLELATLASARQFRNFIGIAQPPNVGRAPSDGPFPRLTHSELGSNGWAIGSELSESGRGMVVANPHFPWEGELKLYESHLTIPGELDVYGASLMGVVGVLIGFNDNVAWTHTVSASQRFVLYRVDLDPSSPTTYMVDGAPREMEGRRFTISVKREDGSLEDRSRTLYRTHYGPVLDIPSVGWPTDLAITMRDANDDNDALIAQFMGMNRAGSMAQFQAVHAEVNGVPWVNTIAADREGTAWYADGTAVPHLSDEAIAAWRANLEAGDFLTELFDDNGVVLLDGSNSMFEWVEEQGARQPGLVPFAKAPQIERSDFVFNSNDSYWLSNPAAPLEGYSPLYGEERTPRTPRTRMNAVLLTERGEGSAIGADGKWALADLQGALLGNRGLMAELLRDDLVARCTGADPVVIEGQSVDITAACEALGGWDLRLDLDSPGALVWREVMSDFDYDNLLDAGVVFATPFDAADPVATPNTLLEPEGETDRMLVALGAATLRLQQAQISPTATLREVQFTKKGEDRIPLHGGQRFEGIANLIIYSVNRSTLGPDMPRGEVINSESDLTSEGYVINYGGSFIMTMEFTDDGPRGEAFLTYSQASTDEGSEHFADQTRLFSDKTWRPILFTEDAIANDPALVVEDVSN